MLKKSRANFTLSCTFSSYICQRNELENGGKKCYSRSHLNSQCLKFPKKFHQRRFHQNFLDFWHKKFNDNSKVGDFFGDFQTLYIFRLKITVIFYAEYLSFSQ